MSEFIEYLKEVFQYREDQSDSDSTTDTDSTGMVEEEMEDAESVVVRTTRLTSRRYEVRSESVNSTGRSSFRRNTGSSSQKQDTKKGHGKGSGGKKYAQK